MLPSAPLFLKALFLTSYVVKRIAIDNNVVRLHHGGEVRGTIMRSEEGKPFFAFKGIPYGEPPLGELRFKAPVAKKGWTDEFDATKEGPICSQVDFFFRPGTLMGQEDCLTLNVYTPKLPKAGKTIPKKDVLVYIHGGGFMLGSSDTNFAPPGRMMDIGNVLVVINYRLDALGFLSTGDEAAPGNYGLLDQTLALQWVKDNIEAFGGNPESVTILGHSAGGGSVSHHLISPLSKGLFHRAMPLSGTALAPWGFDAKPIRWAKYVASYAKCPESPTTAMVECLRTKSTREIVLGMGHYGHLMSFPIPFSPTLDGHFLKATPYDTYFSHPEYINKVPVISGITEEEGAGFVAWLKMLRPNATVTSDSYVNYALNTSISGEYEEIIEKLVNYYELSSPDLRSNEDKFTRRLIKLLSDGLFKMDHYLEVKGLAAAGVPVYAYSYDFQISYVNPIFAMDPSHGVPHGADIFMYFDWKLFGNIPLNKEDRKMSKYLMHMLANFAKTGNPNPTDPQDPTWEQSSRTKFHILKINKERSIQDYEPDSNPDQKFWIDVKNEIQSIKTQ